MVIAERQWRLALAVRKGHQPSEDPDAAYLDEVRPDCRVYHIPANGNGGSPRVIRKVLVDGFWQTEAVAEESASTAE
jgi:hypothetical protein